MSEPLTSERDADLPDERRSSPWLVLCAALALAAGLVGIDARATYGARVSADEPQYLITAISLFEDRDLDVSDEIEERAYLPFHEITINQQTLELNDDGQQISPHDPLLPAIIAIPTGVWGWAGAKATLAVLAAATAATTWLVAVRRFAVSPRVAGVVVSSFFVASPFASYGAQVYPAMPAALATTLGVLFVTGARRTRNDVGVVLAVVALPWLSVKYVPIAAVLALGLLWQYRGRSDRTRLAGLAGALAVAGIAYLVIHQRIWGGWTVYASGDHFVGGEFEVVGTSPNYVARTNRLLGLLIDRYYGLAAWSPAFLLMPAGLVALWRRHATRGNVDRRNVVVVIAVIAVGWAVATWVALTMHGWWWSGRQVVPVLPLVVVAVAVLVERARRLLAPTVLLGIWGLFNWTWIAIEASIGRRALIVDHEDTANPVFQLWKEFLPDHRVDGLVDQIMTIGWGAAFTVSGLWAWRTLSPAPDRSMRDGAGSEVAELTS